MRTINFKAHQNLLKDVITKQAGDKKKGIQELIQNSIDAITMKRRERPRHKGQIRVRVLENGSKSMLTFEDNGVGLGRSQAAVIQNFSVFGLSSKRGDDDLIGDFGMGRGQAISMIYNSKTDELDGNIEVRSNGHMLNNFRVDDKLSFDIQRTPGQHQKGTRWRITSNTPYLFGNMRIDEFITDRIKTDIPIFYNDEPVKATQPQGTKIEKDNFTVWIHKQNGGGLKNGFEVYDRSIYVTDIDVVAGWSGTIITKVPLSQNFARNDILDGDATIDAAKEAIKHAVIEQVNKMNGNSRLSDEKRAGIAQLASSDYALGEQWKSIKLFSTTSGKKVSLVEIQGTKEVFKGKRGDATADRLNLKADVLVLADNPHLTRQLLTRLGIGTQNYMSAQPGTTVHSFLQNKASKDYSPAVSTAKSDVALLSIMTQCFSLRERKLGYGRSDVADGWTDGRSRITLNLDYVKSKVEQYKRQGLLHVLLSLHGLVAHEMAHNNDDTVTMTHGYDFETEEIKWRERQLQGILGLTSDTVEDYEIVLEWRRTMAAKDSKATKKTGAAKTTEKTTPKPAAKRKRTPAKKATPPKKAVKPAAKKATPPKKAAKSDTVGLPSYFSEAVKAAKGVTITSHTKSYALAKKDDKTVAAIAIRGGAPMLILSGAKDLKGCKPVAGWGYCSGIAADAKTAPALLKKHLGI